MDQPLASLVAANVAFVGTHFALSHPLRAPLTKAMGDKGFLGLYSLVSLATFVWIVLAFRAVGPDGAALWSGTGNAAWALASVLTIVALALVFASNKGNPASVGMGAEAAASARATGVFAVTRHPLMWGFAIWAVSHMIVMPTPRTLVTAGAMAVLALLGAHLQDRKKEALLGDAWRGWESRTSFWPRIGKLGGIGAGLWAGAIVAWAAITWLHGWLGTAPAGLWRWVG